MSTIVSAQSVGVQESSLIMYVKGAPEAILAVSTSEIVDESGSIRELTPERAAELKKVH